MKECCRFKLGKCVSQNNPQPKENFAKDAKRKDGLTVHCKSCLKFYRNQNKDLKKETIKTWRANNPDKMAKYRKDSSEKNSERTRRWREKNRLNFLYGISNDQWKEMFEIQNGKCFICQIHSKSLTRGLAVDHCHDSKKVRGLLCHPCNQALGLFKDKIESLERAKEYLLKEF